MERLKNLMAYFVKEFPQLLGRTKLIKAIYLLDCEWYRIYGETYSGLEYRRDNNGPFDTDFYEAKDDLIHDGVILESRYYHGDGTGYEYSFVRKENYEIDLHPIALCMAEEVVERLRFSDLNTFLSLAYSTPPMVAVLAEESESKSKKFGEVLPMSELKKPLKPLFSLDEVKDALKRMDFTPRGSDEEYNEVVFSEFVQLGKTRERVREAWELTGEKL